MDVMLSRPLLFRECIILPPGDGFDHVNKRVLAF